MAAPTASTCSEDKDVTLLPHRFYDHPKMVQLHSYGFPDENQLRLTLFVYLDLAEDKGWWNVQIVPCEILEMAAVCGHSQKSAEREIVLPVRHDADMSHREMQEMSQAIRTEHDINGVILGMVADDSSLLYFRLTEGLVPPDPPEMLQMKKRQQHRKLQRRMKRYNQMAQMSQQTHQVPSYAKGNFDRFVSQHAQSKITNVPHHQGKESNSPTLENHEENMEAEDNKNVPDNKEPLPPFQFKTQDSNCPQDATGGPEQQTVVGSNITTGTENKADKEIGQDVHAYVHEGDSDEEL